jgi:tRNA (adenine57-N1/adenine58-N1)-methyltransferase catalytic subunit
VLAEVRDALEPGGIVCTYLPTTNQVQQSVLAMERGGFAEVQTLEVLVRSWHVTVQSVRPDHRMVAHTGFLTLGRKGLAAGERGEPDPANG